jgi:hypothetical protein
MDIDQLVWPSCDHEFTPEEASSPGNDMSDLDLSDTDDDSPKAAEPISLCEGTNIRTGVRCKRFPRKGYKFCVLHMKNGSREQHKVSKPKASKPKVNKLKASKPKPLAQKPKHSLSDELIELSKRVRLIEEHKVARILHRRIKGGKWEYLVSWEESWVPREDLNCPEILSRYISCNGKK